MANDDIISNIVSGVINFLTPKPQPTPQQQRIAPGRERSVASQPQATKPQPQQPASSKTQPASSKTPTTTPQTMQVVNFFGGPTPQTKKTEPTPTPPTPPTPTPTNMPVAKELSTKNWYDVKQKPSPVSESTPPAPKVEARKNQIVTSEGQRFNVINQDAKPTKTTEILPRIVGIDRSADDYKKTLELARSGDIGAKGLSVLEGYSSLVESVGQPISNIIGGVPADEQSVKKTALDLIIDPLIAPFITPKQVMQKDPVTGELVPQFDESGKPIYEKYSRFTPAWSSEKGIVQWGENLQYLWEVGSNEKARQQIVEGFGESAKKFSENPEYYTASAQAEIATMLIGVGQVNLAAKILSKAGAFGAARVVSSVGKVANVGAMKQLNLGFKEAYALTHIEDIITKTQTTASKIDNVSKNFDASVDLSDDAFKNQIL